MQAHRSARFSLALAPALALVFTACGGGGSAGGSGSSSSSGFNFVEVSNGFGKLLPYKIAVLDASGQPSTQVIEVTKPEQLIANLTFTNPVQSPVEWPAVAKLPDSKPGNHFIYARFSQDLDLRSVLGASAAAGPGALSDAVQVEQVNSTTGEVTPIRGRAFVGGRTFGPTLSPTTPGELALETWVVRAPTGELSAATIGGEQPGLGFPGTETSFAGDSVLIEPSTLVFVVDSDNDLSTHETFPSGVQILMRITTGVRSARGRSLPNQGLASSTVGQDLVVPEVLVRSGTQEPMIEPGNHEFDVDPATNIEIHFTEPVSILKVGELEDGTPPGLSASVQVKFGPDFSVEVPFHVRLFSVFDLSRFTLVPVYDFPGTGPLLSGAACGQFGQVKVLVNPAQLEDLSVNHNKNVLGRDTDFFTREGVGVVNAPVTPDVVYIGRTGSNQGVSIIDLNGFGASTGDPTYDPENPIIQGNSNYPNNPNVRVQGAILSPPLFPGSCTFDGGSAGPFTLTKDTSLNDLVARAPLIESVSDMTLGHALDTLFNNESPFGCQAGGGNICAQSGLKQVAIIPAGPNTVASSNFAPVPIIKIDDGVENLACWAPHPNPPPLSFPPLCLSPLINGVEPTSITSFLALNTNLLGPGPLPLGNPDANMPPLSLLTLEQNCFFEGPSAPLPVINACPRYMYRQQVGQFLYIADRAAGEVVVLNSNRFTVIDRIRLPDPTSFAMSPNMDFLAVTNEGADQVSFIDTDPGSATFHKVVRTTRVGIGPTGIAWEPSNEDIFVCNQSEGTVSLISAFTLQVRKTLRNQITRPIDVAITPRQTTFGFLRGVYFAYILNQNGKLAFFESGPDGINGIGFDDVVSTLPFTFSRPKTLQVDPTNQNSGVWVVHEDPLGEDGLALGVGGGAISNVGIAGGTIGIIPIDPGAFFNPLLRELEFGVIASFGEGDGLSGIPVDIAFDNLRNVAAFANFSTQFSAGNPLPWNGKSIEKAGNFNIPIPASAPQFLFAAVPNPGVVDVFDITTTSLERFDVNVFEPGVQPIVAPNASLLMDYFRQ